MTPALSSGAALAQTVVAEPGVAGPAGGFSFGLEKDVQRELDEIDGLDAEGGLARFGSAEIYVSLLESFAKHTGELLDSVKDVSPEKLSEYAVTVHGIKGSSRSISAPEVGNMAERLEMAAKGGDYDAVSGANGEFIEMTERLVKGINDFLAERNASAPKRDILEAPDAGALRSLYEKCRAFDTVGMEETLNELRSYDYDKGGELISWLGERMDELDYEGIAGRLKDEAWIWEDR
jgi:HPt (histidine-containing phosphotransfer) domain-containing protein